MRRKAKPANLRRGKASARRGKRSRGQRSPRIVGSPRLPNNVKEGQR
jgi:hypothetical protein